MTNTHPKPNNELSKRQLKALNFIIRFIKDHGFPPTVRELQKELGVSSVRGASIHLEALEKKGYIERSGKARGIRILRHPLTHTSAEDTLKIPLVGQVAAGKPILAEENIEKYVAVKRKYLGGAQNAFLLRVEGDSMIEAGIQPGDLAIVLPTNTAQNGDVVIALMEDSATLKKFHQVEDYVALLPANKKYPPIIGKEFDIQGKVIGVIREEESQKTRSSLLKDGTLVPVYRVPAESTRTLTFGKIWSFGTRH